MNVLVIAPHPDDDALGCGGAIRKHVNDGDTVMVAYLTSGENGVAGENPELTALIREEEAGVCAQVLGIHRQIYLRFPDGGLSEAIQLPEALTQLLDVTQPDLVYAPHGGEGHPDHMTTGRLVRKIAGGRIPVRFYEVWTPLPSPDVLVDITAVVSEKRGAIRAYASQASRNAFVEGILALNHYRGLLHGPNLMYAEAFGVA